MVFNIRKSVGISSLNVISYLKIPIVNSLPSQFTEGGQLIGVRTGSGVDFYYYDGDTWFKIVASGSSHGLPNVLAIDSNSGGVNNIILDNNAGVGVGALTSAIGNNINLLAGANTTSTPGAGTENINIQSATTGQINMAIGTTTIFRIDNSGDLEVIIGDLDFINAGSSQSISQTAGQNLTVESTSGELFLRGDDINLLPNGAGETLLKANPITSLGAATKQYVDAVASGLDVKASVRVKTAAALSTAATPAGSGVGKTITNSGVQAALTIDTIALSNGNRILIDQVGSTGVVGLTNVDNGIYTVTDIGSGGSDWIVTRSTDADEDFEVTAGMFTFVEEGAQNANQGYVLTSNDPIIVDTTPLLFSKFSEDQTGFTTVDNSAYGIGALTNLSTGVDNTSIGVNTLGLLTITNDNTAVGDNALAANTAAENTAIGSSALLANTTGTENTALGFNTLSTITVGLRCTAVGYSALTLNTGSNNTAVGANALTANTSGAGNIALGSNTLISNTIGNTNIAIGSNALSTNITSSNNIAVGGNTMLNATGSADCIAIGPAAMQDITTGDQNIAIGTSALRGVTTGARNTIVGYTALASGSTGTSDCTAIGADALSATTGTENTGLGGSTGVTLTTGGGNTLVGYTADVTSSSSTERIAIGKSARTTSDYSCQIGDPVVSGGVAGTLNYRSQIVSNEVWVGGGTGRADIDNSGNIIRGMIPAYVSITTDEISNGSSGELDPFQDSSYAAYKFNTNVTASGITYTSVDGRFTVANDGIYHIEVNAYLQDSGADLVTLRIKDTGVTVWTASPAVDSTVDPVELSASLIRSMSAGDYIEFTFDATVALRLANSVPGTTMNIWRIN